MNSPHVCEVSAATPIEYRWVWLFSGEESASFPIEHHAYMTGFYGRKPDYIGMYRRASDGLLVHIADICP